MANVKLKKKKGESGYEQLYPQTLAKNVISSTGTVQTDINILRFELNNLKNINIIETESGYSDGTNQYYEVSSMYGSYFNSSGITLKIVFIESNRGGNVVIRTYDDMGFMWEYEILKGFYDVKFRDNEIEKGKIYTLLGYNYKWYLMG